MLRVTCARSLSLSRRSFSKPAIFVLVRSASMRRSCWRDTTSQITLVAFVHGTLERPRQRWSFLEILEHLLEVKYTVKLISVRQERPDAEGRNLRPVWQFMPFLTVHIPFSVGNVLVVSRLVSWYTWSVLRTFLVNLMRCSASNTNSSRGTHIHVCRKKHLTYNFDGTLSRPVCHEHLVDPLKAIAAQACGPRGSGEGYPRGRMFDLYTGLSILLSAVTWSIFCITVCSR